MIDFGLGKLRLWSAAAACAGAFMTQAAGTHPATFTLNDVMQEPFPSYMLAAPTGAAVAWVFDAKGCKTASRLAGAGELRNAALRPAFGVTSSTSRFK